MREYEPNEWYNNIYDLGNLCLQNSSGVMWWITPYTEKEVDEINVALSMIINYAKDTEEDIIDRNQKILGLY